MELQRCWWHKIGNVLAALPKSAHPAAEKALAEIYNAENKAAAVKAAHNFATEYGAKWPKAVAKIVDDLDVQTAFYDYPAEHWIHLRTTDESFKAGVALSAGWDGVSLLGGRGRPRSEEQGLGAGSPAAQLAP
jgi:transposase-like protein